MKSVIFKSFFAVILIIIVGISPFAHSYFTDVLDKTIDCADDINPQLLLIVFDISDPYDARDISYVKKDIDSIFRRTSKSTKFHILQVTEDELNSPIPILSGNIIPSIDRMPFYLKVVASVDIRNEISARNKEILELCNAHTEQILKSKSLRTSPIIESIINITKSYEFQSANDIKIILYSDMRQNTKTLNLLRYTSSGIDLDKLGYSKISLKNAMVEVRYIKRSSLENDKLEQQIRRFWDTWFAQATGKVHWR